MFFFLILTKYVLLKVCKCNLILRNLKNIYEQWVLIHSLVFLTFICLAFFETKNKSSSNKSNKNIPKWLHSFPQLGSNISCLQVNIKFFRKCKLDFGTIMYNYLIIKFFCKVELY